jgi:hypothetical protein
VKNFTCVEKPVLQAIIIHRKLKQLFILTNFFAFCYGLIFLFAVMLNMLAIKPSAPNVCLQINELEALKLGTDQCMSVCQIKPIPSGASEYDQSWVII